jgi:5-formyltetrahydrofolate cyclo-ligase
MRPKAITRRTVVSRRDALSDEERAIASDTIADAATSLLATLTPGASVALYAPKGSEVDTRRIDTSARARGLRVVYPRIVDGDRRLAFHEVTIDELEPSKFGLREPPRASRVLGRGELDALIIPGLAFDRAGGRIGWGRGHYDATLAEAPRALRIGLAFECQVFDQVPRDPHDVLLHYVVTETSVYRAPD